MLALLFRYNYPTAGLLIPSEQGEALAMDRPKALKLAPYTLVAHCPLEYLMFVSALYMADELHCKAYCLVDPMDCTL